jgi:hypothetical protein
VPEFVRVKDKSTGHKFSVVASAVDESAQIVLKQDAVDVGGDPLPPEYAEKTGATTTSKEKSDG